MAGVERSECVGRRAHLRLRAVEDIRDEGENDEVVAASSPQALPERAAILAGGWTRGCGGCAHEDLLAGLLEDHIRCCRSLQHLALRVCARGCVGKDRKSTRLNSSHPSISYAVFCLKKKTIMGGWEGHGV